MQRTAASMINEIVESTEPINAEQQQGKHEGPKRTTSKYVPGTLYVLWPRTWLCELMREQQQRA